MQFIAKTIDAPQTCGQKLREARERLGMSVSDAAHATGIQAHYLAHLEDDALDCIPGAVYARHYIGCYAAYLSLPVSALLAQHDRERSWHHSPLPSLREAVTPARFANWPNRIIRVILTGAVFVFLALLALPVAQRFSPPPLQLLYPPEGYLTHVDTLTLTGASEPEARLTVNGVSVVPQEDGTFFHELHLSYGINVIRLTARRRFGKEATVTRTIIKDGMAQSPSATSFIP